jgi:hypothetical protein
VVSAGAGAEGGRHCSPMPQTTKTWRAFSAGRGGHFERVPLRPIRTCRSRRALCRSSGAYLRQQRRGGAAAAQDPWTSAATWTARRRPLATARTRGWTAWTGSRHGEGARDAARAEVRVEPLPVLRVRTVASPRAGHDGRDGSNARTDAEQQGSRAAGQGQRQRQRQRRARGRATGHGEVGGVELSRRSGASMG